jgi:ketosteroid isomerase-like protein
MIFLFTLVTSCKDHRAQVVSLSEENNKLQEEYQQQLLETRKSTAKADSLQTIVHSLQNQVQKMKGEMPVYNASSEDEKAIEALVNNLHKGWTAMMEKDDTNEILKYFLPQYTTSSVRINTANIPSVQRSNNANFEEHLNEIMLANDVTLTFGQTNFLYTEVKGDIFVTSYRTRLRVYQNNQEMHTSSLVTQLAGQKRDGEWKVGNYNWVTFNY